MLEVWYESPDGSWAIVPDLGGEVDMAHLRKVGKQADVPDNTLEFTLATDPKAVFYLDPDLDDVEEGGEVSGRGNEIKGVMEKSMRETRMKRGAGVGALHQYVALPGCSYGLC